MWCSQSTLGQAKYLRSKRYHSLRGGVYRVVGRTYLGWHDYDEDEEYSVEKDGVWEYVPSYALKTNFYENSNHLSKYFPTFQQTSKKKSPPVLK